METKRYCAELATTAQIMFLICKPLPIYNVHTATVPFHKIHI